jgi:hypothetical protein
VKRSLAILLLPSFAAATPAFAQSALSLTPQYPELSAQQYSFDAWKVEAEPRLPVKKPIITLPLGDYTRPDGTRTSLRGVIVAKEVAPDVTIGIGLLGMKPKRSTFAADPALDGGSRGSRKAAVRLTMKF